jgi:hypothetical protein
MTKPFIGAHAKTETIYLVRFDRGYYAESQPNYEWSFTDNPMLAKQYKKAKGAKERGVYGCKTIQNPLQFYVVERYTLNTSLDFEGVETEKL